MMYYPASPRPITPVEQKARELAYNKRIKIALDRYEAYKQRRRHDTRVPQEFLEEGGQHGS